MIDPVRAGQGEKRAAQDEIRVCRCGTYPRTREAIKKGAARMA